MLAIIWPRERRLIEWSPTLKLEAGDVLILLGKREQLHRLAELAGTVAKCGLLDGER